MIHIVLDIVLVNSGLQRPLYTHGRANLLFHVKVIGMVFRFVTITLLSNGQRGAVIVIQR